MANHAEIKVQVSFDPDKIQSFLDATEATQASLRLLQQNLDLANESLEALHASAKIERISDDTSESEIERTTDDSDLES